MLIHLRIIHGCFCTTVHDGMVVTETHDIMCKTYISSAKIEIFAIWPLAENVC